MNHPTATRDVDTTPPDDPPTPRRVPAWITRALRVLTGLLALAAVLQPVVAGMFVSGDVALLAVHLIVAMVMLLLSLLLIVATVLLWRPGRGSARPIIPSVVLFLLVLGQTALGMLRVLELHFPLAFGVIALTVVLTRQAWSRSITVASPRVRAGGDR